MLYFSILRKKKNRWKIKNEGRHFTAVIQISHAYESK